MTAHRKRKVVIKRFSYSVFFVIKNKITCVTNKDIKFDENSSNELLTEHF